MTTGPAPMRTEESFSSNGTRCAAWLYRPAGSSAVDAGAPIVVMAHGFGGVRGMRLDAYAQRFAAAGYLVLLFDYRCFGDSDGEPRQLLHIGRQHEDWAAAVAHARELPGVDPDRVVLWGTSLSGGHVLAAARHDHRVAAVVAQVPHVSGTAAALAVGPVASVRLGIRSIADSLGALAGRPPLYIRSIGRPDQLAAMSSPDAQPGLDRLIAESGIDTPDERVAARVILQMSLYSPGRGVSAIRCPVLFQIVDQDVITPTKVAGRVARRIRDVEIKHYPGGHFDPYVEPLFDSVVGDQLAFLERVTPVS